MKPKKETKQYKDIEFNPSRRRFIKKIGIGSVAASAYSVLSLTHFSCSDSTSPETDFSRGGYGYFNY